MINFVREFSAVEGGFSREGKNSLRKNARLESEEKDLR